MNHLLLVGEGSDDVGNIENGSKGVAQNLFERLLRERFGKEPVIETKILKDYKTVRGFSKKVATILNNETFEFVLIMVDRDDVPDRLAELIRGREMVGDPRNCVVGLAVEMLEAWLLTDVEAWQAIFQTRPSLPEKPEQCWGHPSASSHPKIRLNQALERCSMMTASQKSNAKRRIAEITNLKELALRCPEGFGFLVEEIRARWFPWVKADAW